jgi:hypothetical protein
MRTGEDVAAGPGAAVRKRPNLTIRVSNKLYAEIQAAADQAGRSLSEEVERRLERAAEWDSVFDFAAALKAKIKTDHEELERGDTEAVLPRRGYMKVFDVRFGGHAWIPPGHHLAVHEQITSQAEFREFQSAERTAAGMAKETSVKERVEDLERQVRFLRQALPKDEGTQ